MRIITIHIEHNYYLIIIMYNSNHQVISVDSSQTHNDQLSKDSSTVFSLLGSQLQLLIRLTLANEEIKRLSVAVSERSDNFVEKGNMTIKLERQLQDIGEKYKNLLIDNYGNKAKGKIFLYERRPT
jgi:hypothetical protein